MKKTNLKFVHTEVLPEGMVVVVEDTKYIGTKRKHEGEEN